MPTHLPDLGRFSWKRRITLGLGPIAAVAVYAALPAEFRDIDDQLAQFTHSGRATAALMTLMALWWITETIDISATALLPLVILPAAGASSISDAAAPYASELIFLFMGGFLLALSMQRWGLDKRISLITLKLVGTRQHMMVAGFMVATAMISAFVSNTATAAMMLPIGIGVINLTRSASTGAPAAHDRNFAVCLMLGIAYAASIGGVATIVGSPPNAFLVGFAREDLNVHISFRDWMFIGVPLAGAFLPIAWLLLTRVMFPVRRDEVPGGREYVRRELASLGSFNRGQVVTLVVFLSAAILWILRPTLSGITIGQVAPLQFMGDAGIAMAAGMVLFVFPAGDGRFVMDWQTAEKLPWGILILFGGGLSLAHAIQSNGVAEFIASHVRHVGTSPIILILVITTAVILLSELASNTATAATLVPILAAMAEGLGINPFLLIVPATLAASCAFMLPAGTPPNAMVFGSGVVTMRDMVRAGFWLNITGVILITTLAMLLPNLWPTINPP